MFSCFWLPFCSLSLPVQGPVCQPNGADPTFSHHLPHRNKRRKWWHPHHHVSTALACLQLASQLHEEQTQVRKRCRHTWKQLELWHERAINGNDWVNYLLEALFCASKSNKGLLYVVVVGDVSSSSLILTSLLTFKPSNDPISGNTSLTFLITLDRDLGDLMLLKLRWEGGALWESMWMQVKTIIPWGGPDRQPLLTVGKISIKAGETQER